MDVAMLKEGARRTWASGDFDRIAELILPVGRGIVERAGVSAGMEVLDVGAGTGNASIPAAETGAKVIASDLTPELFEAGRRRAEAAGVEIEWVEGDAEDLPFESDRFDVVTSTFGAMFAPRHEVAAAEMARVTKPGGLIAMCNWTPEGRVGTFFKLVAKHNTPPEGVPSPLLWGTEAHVREVFEPHGIRLEFDRQLALQEFESAEAYVSLFENYFGPIVMAKAALEPQGKWDAFRAEYLSMCEAENTATDGGFRFETEYLVVLGRKAG